MKSGRIFLKDHEVIVSYTPSYGLVFSCIHSDHSLLLHDKSKDLTLLLLVIYMIRNFMLVRYADKFLPTRLNNSFNELAYMTLNINEYKLTFENKYTYCLFNSDLMKISEMLDVEDKDFVLNLANHIFS